MPSASKVASQALFQQTLADVLRQLRSTTTSVDEEEMIARIMEDTRKEVTSSLVSVKVVAVQKALYFSMMGCSPEFAFFPIVEIMSDQSFSNKRVAYTAASLCFSEDADVLTLTTSLLLRDLQSTNPYEQALALSFLSSVCTTELARDVVSYVVDLLDVRHPAHIRKRAVICLYKLFLEYPDALRPVYLKMKDKVDDGSPERDTDSGVRGAVVCVLCELARRLPETYLGLAIPFYSLLSSIEGNWALIKVVKVFGYFVPHEPRLVKKLVGPLEKLIETTKATSVKYECYLTIMSTTLSTVPSLASIAVQGIESFLEDSDQNLRFMGLEAASRLAATNPKALHGLRKAVMRSLEDEDTTIRRKAALILRDITTEKHLVNTVMLLLAQSVTGSPPDEGWTGEVVLRVVELVRKDDYARLTDFDWYISVLMDLYRLPTASFAYGDMVEAEVLSMLLRVSAVRTFATKALSELFLGSTPLPPPPPPRRSSKGTSKVDTRWRVLIAAAFACGEYCAHLSDETRMRLCHFFTGDDIQIYPAVLQCTCLWAVAKLQSSLRPPEAAAAWLREGPPRLSRFQFSPHPSVVETAQAVGYLLTRDTDRVSPLAARLFNGELLPVADGAQEACQAPETVDLEAFLCPRDVLEGFNPLSDSETEEAEAEDPLLLRPTYIPGVTADDGGAHSARASRLDRHSPYYLDEAGDRLEPPQVWNATASDVVAADPARATRQLLAERRRTAGGSGGAAKESLLRPVAGAPTRLSPAPHQEEEDEITRRLRGVDVNAALTAADALPQTRLSYAALQELTEQQRSAQERRHRELLLPPLIILETEWLRVRLVAPQIKKIKSSSAALRGAVRLKYTVEMECLRAASAASGSGDLTGLSLEVCGEEAVGGWSSLLLMRHDNEAEATSRVGLAALLREGTSAAVSVSFVMAALPDSIVSTPIKMKVVVTRWRQVQSLPFSFSIPYQHFIAKTKKRQAAGWSSAEFHSMISASHDATAAAAPPSDVLFAEVPCGRNDLLMAVPQLRTSLGLQAVDVFPDAMVLCTDLVVPGEAGQEETQSSARESSSRRGQCPAVVFLQEKVPSSSAESPSAYSVTVYVRCASPALCEAIISAVVEVLQGA